jgi:GNAT superfamily N-acetyltransferase
MIADELAPPDLDAVLHTWVRGWAAARELGPPVRERAAWRVEVGWPQQRRRHVFARPCDELRALGASISEPWVFVKCCTTPQALRACLPPRWTVGPRSSLMVFEGEPPPAAALPAGYAIEFDAGAEVPQVRVSAPDGTLAADGRVVVLGTDATFDRIGTHADHRRRGLASAVMRTLHGIAHARGARRGLLAATIEGEALYRTVGWRVHAPYASAVIGDDARG